jgi:hypothetical protein
MRQRVSVREHFRRGNATIGDCQVTFQLATHEDDPALPAPAMQPQLGLLALPTMAGIGPVGVPHRPFHRPLYVLGQAQTEQIIQLLPLGSRHHRFDAP